MQTSKIVVAIEKLIGIEYMRSGIERKPVTQNDVMPSRYVRPKIKRAKPKPEDSTSMFSRLVSAFGLKKVVDSKHGNNDQSG